MKNTALIVDDDRTERRMMISALRGSIDLNFQEAENGRDALRVLGNDHENKIALIVLDLDMPVMNGTETLEILRKNYQHIPVIILTGNTETDKAVNIMKMGATDFLTKPIQNARLDVSARNALKMSIMGHEISRLKRQTNGETKFTDLIGHNRGLNHSVQIGIKAAANTLPVLITGETGTGKEVFARAIHGESKRSGQNFIAVNCGAIPEKLVESTLFGHEKGAFTGATEKALGKFQEASGGTIFLDEVGELPLEAQVKLLRVLQQNEVEPVGGGKPIPINVRVISATNRNLSQDVERGLFREDLFFRLNVLHVNLPPLRNRKEDIPQIVEHFIEKFCAANHEIHKMISEDAMQKMINHNWPGNVRELENIIYRTMALCDEETISADHINFIQIVSDQNTSAYNKTINSLNDDGKFKSFKTLEQEIITLALKHHDGNITQTARSLGIAKSTLYSKIETLADQKSA